METLANFAPHPSVIYDVVLQIAPLFGYDNPGLKFHRYVLLGSHKNSVNSPKGSGPDLSDRAISEGCAVVIESAVAAKMRPEPPLLNKLPANLRRQVIEVGFKLMIKRCAPEAPYAEGLITFPYGRGVGYTSVQNLYSAFARDSPDAVPFESIDVSQSSYQTAVTYASELAAVKPMILVDKDGNLLDPPPPSPERIREMTIEKLARMYRALNIILGIEIPLLYDSTYPAFRASRDGDQAFSKFSHVVAGCCEALNPVYDLFAAFVAVSGTDANSETKSSFNERVVTLF
jgi:hypothetical protein